MSTTAGGANREITFSLKYEYHRDNPKTFKRFQDDMADAQRRLTDTHSQGHATRDDASDKQAAKQAAADQKANDRALADLKKVNNAKEAEQLRWGARESTRIDRQLADARRKQESQHKEAASFAERMGRLGEQGQRKEDAARERSIKEAGRRLNKLAADNEKAEKKAESDKARLAKQAAAEKERKFDFQSDATRRAGGSLIEVAKSAAEFWIAGDEHAEGMIRNLVRLKATVDGLHIVDLFRSLGEAGILEKGSAFAKRFPLIGGAARGGAAIWRGTAGRLGLSAAGTMGTAVSSFGAAAVGAGAGAYMWNASSSQQNMESRLGEGYKGYDPHGMFWRVGQAQSNALMGMYDYLPGTYSSYSMIDYGGFAKAAANRARLRRLQARDKNVGERMGEYFGSQEWRDTESMRGAERGLFSDVGGERMQMAGLRTPLRGETARFDYDPILRQRQEIERQRENERGVIGAQQVEAEATFKAATERKIAAQSAFDAVGKDDGEVPLTTEQKRLMDNPRALAAYNDAKVRGDRTPETDYIVAPEEGQRTTIEVDRRKAVVKAQEDLNSAIEAEREARSRVNELSKQEYESLLKSLEAQQRLAVETQRRGKSLTRTLAEDPRSLALYRMGQTAIANGTQLPPQMWKMIDEATGGNVPAFSRRRQEVAEKTLNDQKVELPDEIKNAETPESVQQRENEIRSRRATEIGEQGAAMREAASQLDPALRGLTAEIINLIQEIRKGRGAQSGAPTAPPQSSPPLSMRGQSVATDRIAAQQYNAQRQAAIG